MSKIIFFRICKEKYTKQLLASGIANRWNNSGEFVIYAGSTRSLSTLESVVHRNSINLKESYKLVLIEVNNYKHNSQLIKLDELPENWNTFQNISFTQNLGSEWYQKEAFLVLEVPSAIIGKENNIIINTKHPLFKSDVKICALENYFWDQRLLSF